MRSRIMVLSIALFALLAFRPAFSSAATAEPSPSPVIPVEDLAAMVDALKSQGLATESEANGLKARLAAPKAAEGQAAPLKPAIVPGTDVPYAPPKMAPVYLRTMIDLMERQGALRADEATILRDRLERKNKLDRKVRAADNVVTSFEAQLEELRSREVIGPAESERLLREVKAALAPLKAPVLPKEPVFPRYGELPPSQKVRMSEENLKGLIATLGAQGLIDGEEASALSRRVEDKNADPPIPDSGDFAPALHAGREIPYAITTMPRSTLGAVVGILQQQGILAKGEVETLEARYVAKAPVDRLAGGVVREVRPEVQTQLKKDVKEEVALEAKRTQLPEWTRRFRFSGDLRLRFQADLYGEGNADFLDPNKPTEVLNTHEDRYRGRIRLRLNVLAKVTDDVEVGIRMATGNLTDPVSTNQTIGDYENKKYFLLDLAYVKWSPGSGFTSWGGRIPNPYFSTDLVWDSDLNFDGLAATYTRQLAYGWNGFATAGAFMIQEVAQSSKDKYLLGFQVGAQYAPRPELAAKFGLSFYDFKNITGIANSSSNPNEFDYTAPQFLQKGNTLFDISPTSTILPALAAEYQELNLTAALDLGYWHPIHVVFLGDYVRNIGFDKDDVAARTGNPDVEEEVDGYMIGMAVGYPSIEKYGDWKAYLFYKHLESDAVVDAFTDSDFHLGGTNAEGWILGGEYGLARNISLAAKYLTANEISGPPLSIDVFQLDLNVRF